MGVRLGTGPVSRSLPAPRPPREMPRFRPLAAALAVLAAPVAGAQAPRLAADAPRVLFSVTDSVKTDDGRRARVTRTVTYDPVAGEYRDETVEAGGRVLARSVRRTSLAGPTPLEAAAARALVEAHPEVAAAIAAAEGDVTVEGGFPLVREPGHPCGPGGRCVLVDVYATPPGEPGAPGERLRHVVVDLRALRVLEADADPQADGNLGHPAARRQSRHQ